MLTIMENVDIGTLSKPDQVRALGIALKRLVSGYVDHYLHRDEYFPKIDEISILSERIKAMLSHIDATQERLWKITNWWKPETNSDWVVILPSYVKAININELELYFVYLKNALWSAFAWSTDQSLENQGPLSQGLPHQFSSLKASIFFRNGIPRFSMPDHVNKRALLKCMKQLSLDPDGIELQEGINRMDVSLKKIMLSVRPHQDISMTNQHLQSFLRNYLSLYWTLLEYINKMDIRLELDEILTYWEDKDIVTEYK